MKTVREAKLDNLILRLVEKDNLFIGLIIAGEVKKLQIDGTSADDVWRRLHDEAGKTNPKYFGFDGARARFLRFFQMVSIQLAIRMRSATTKLPPKRNLMLRCPLRMP